MRLEFAREALADLDAIYRHGVAEFGAAQADRYADALARTLDLICEYPAITPVIPDRSDGLRRRSVGVHSLYFTATPDLVRVVRVLHQRMDVEGQGGTD
ncbi:MAG: type II toxin-antitoxin system RelE/ParE family toxin [Sandarakinorhabdus sp.]|nr:type II toxin-antitoxin system RelE/ParE family toxin [Sandarakinorhabdus sp.]